MISRTTTRVSAAHGQCARGRHGRTGIESVIEWWLVQLLMGPDARATHRREREEESVSSNGMEKNVRNERTSRERKEEGARKKGLSPKKSARARALLLPLHRCTTDGCILPSFPEPFDGRGEPKNRETAVWPRLDPTSPRFSLSLPRVQR